MATTVDDIEHMMQCVDKHCVRCNDLKADPLDYPGRPANKPTLTGHEQIGYLRTPAEVFEREFWQWLLYTHEGQHARWEAEKSRRGSG